MNNGKLSTDYPKHARNRILYPHLPFMLASRRFFLLDLNHERQYNT